MELTQLSHFRAVARLKSITQASREEYISQPALTKSIQKLEDELGHQLFYRMKNGVELTDSGQILSRYADTIFAQIEEMKRELNSVDEKDMPIVIGTVEMAFFRSIAQTLEEMELPVNFSAKNIQDGEAVSALLSRKIDIVMGTHELREPGISSVPLFDNRLYVSVPENNPLRLLKKLTFSDLRGQKILRHMDRNSLYSQRITEHLQRGNLGIDCLDIEDYYIYSRMAGTSGRLLFTSNISIRTLDVRKGRVLIPITDSDLNITYFWSWRSKNTRAAAFFQWIFDNYQAFQNEEQEK